jgi:transposase
MAGLRWIQWTPKLRHTTKTEISDMEKIPRSVFTKEFKEEAVKMVVDGGLSQPEVCRRLSLGYSMGETGMKRRYSQLNEASFSHRRGDGDSSSQGRKRRTENGARYLKKASAYFCQRVAESYSVIKTLRLTYPSLFSAEFWVFPQRRSQFFHLSIACQGSFCLTKGGPNVLCDL